MKIQKKWLVIAGVILLVGVIGFSVYKAKGMSNSGGKIVQTAEVKAVNLASKIISTGKIQSQVSRTVGSDLAGKIKAVYVSPGDTVKVGQVLAQLDTNDLVYKIQSKELQIQSEQQRLAIAVQSRNQTQKVAYEVAKRAEESAKKDYQNNQALYVSGAVSESALREAQTKYDQALNARVAAETTYLSEDTVRQSRIQIQILQQELEQLRTNETRSLLKSPIDGTVTEVNIKTQDAVAENTALLVVEDISKMEAVVKISEYDIGKIKLGMPATIKASGLKNTVIKGVVSKIAPSAKVDTNGQAKETTIEVRVAVSEPVPGLKSNFSAEVTILSDSKSKAKTVPYEALYVPKDGAKKLFLIQNGVLKEQPVQTGIEGDLEVEVRYPGIKEGDVVLLNPTESDKNGDKVTVLPESKEGKKK